MTSNESELRIQKLRIRTWCHIVLAAIYVSGALFFAIKQIVIGAILLVGFTAMSAVIVTRSVE